MNAFLKELILMFKSFYDLAPVAFQSSPDKKHTQEYSL